MEQKTKRKELGALVLLAAAVAVLLGVYVFLAPKGTAGEKEIIVQVVHGDGSSREFAYATSQEYLGSLLQEEGLIAGEESSQGLFVTTVDGEAADADSQQWWSVTKEGEQVNTGVDQTPIAQGDHFELTLMSGW